MRILYVITKSSIGGAQTHISQLSARLKEDGHTFAVVAQPGGWLEEKTKELGGVFYSASSFVNSLNPLRFFVAKKDIARAVNGFCPDVVACHSGIAGLFARLYIRNKIPTVFTAHGWSFAPGTPFFRRWATIIAEKIASYFCTKIICVSRYDHDLALRYMIGSYNKLTVISNAVELPKRGQQKDSSHIPLSIVFMGRLDVQKNPYVLIDAISQLSEGYRNKIMVTFIGDGPEKQNLTEYVTERNLDACVAIQGFIFRDKALEILKDADLFVLTSHWEGMPYSILEAMSFEIPVIASDVGGVSEVVTENTGVILDKEDELDHLTRTLERFIIFPETREKIGNAARKRIENYFTIERLYQKTLSVYEKLGGEKFNE